MGPRVLVIGSSLAGLRSAEAVLAALPDARVTLVGDEPHAPYNRPPLSKEALAGLVAGDAGLDKLTFRHRLDAGAVTWRLGARAISVDAANRAVRLGDGEALPYDWLIAASGLRPRRLAFPGGEARHVLRGIDDARQLAAAIRPGARMLVVGAGFIGCELAATAMKLGLSASVIEPAAQPMLAALGPDVAAAMAGFHRARGVDLRCGLSVTGDENGALILSDGSRIDGDLTVESVGSVPNVEWLSGAGLDLTNGVLCDATLTALGSDRILAVGDVARFPNALFDATPRRVEHWSIPGLTARRAAETIAARTAGAEPPARFAPLPGFWSDQHGLRLQSFGAPGLGDEIRVLEGELAAVGQSPCLVEYRRAGRPVGILGLGAAPAALAQHRARLDRVLNEAVAA
ncbi:NAD(P)/FAD-dependent oxidoreductase [Tabrizicola sp.]|uniref:NAD(P)/FAD-dependent oxidoreductase n=1 Tax=Tabrizicola sp. TaxID=2005166 RepID=UPI002634C1AD|nr:FAD-dependent oxidoreductase [Tabrizicola sp.]MDM7933004.1 FAD-dependent oxidoreductase [Tabrizicola sp.]